MTEINGVLVPTNTTWVTTGTGTGTVTWPTTGTSPTIGLPGITTLEVKTPEVEEKKVKVPPRKLVEFPRRVTRKVVIGFVEDENDEVVWGAKLYISDFHIDYDADGTGRLTLCTELYDADPEPDE